MNLTLCCLFHKEPIKFRTYRKADVDNIEKVLEVINHNIDSLQKALDYCHENGIAGYRISSDLIPHADSVIEADLIQHIGRKLKNLNTHGLNLSVHPGQHVNLGSPNTDVVQSSLRDLTYHHFLATSIGFDEINIHVGGTYGNKEETRERFIKNFRELVPDVIKPMITLENDELSWSAGEVYGICNDLNLRMVFDVHHHRCHELKDPSGLDEQILFAMAKHTWSSTQIQRIHISSPRCGEYATASKSRAHADLIEDGEYDWYFHQDDIIIDVEAKHKEVAIEDIREKMMFKSVLS